MRRVLTGTLLALVAAACGEPAGNTNHGDACTPEADLELCAAAQAQCDVLAATDRCGAEREVECGDCSPPTCEERVVSYPTDCAVLGDATTICQGPSCEANRCVDGTFEVPSTATRLTDGDVCGPEAEGRCADARCVVTTEGPVLGFDHPDPHVLRDVAADGTVSYYLTATVHNAGDIPVYRSSDLVHWEQATPGLFGRSSTPGSSIAINDGHFCSLWAPQLVSLGPASYLLSFSAQRFDAPQSPCPAYHEDGGVYLAWSASPLGPFADATHAWEPLPAGGQVSTCPADVRDHIPRSLWTSSEDCQGGFCHQVIRLDSDVFRDPATGRWWLAYSWYTNRPPQVAWEEANHGEHVSLVELDASDPFAVICDLAVPQVHVANPHDAGTLAQLAASCDGCDDRLSMTRGRYGEELVFDGFSWGITEGASLFRRGDWVYLLISGSAWDSAYYHVYWVAAPTVEELAYANPDRLVGRYLIPGQPVPGDPASPDWAFGHGTAVLGPDGASWYFVHHRLDSTACRSSGDCRRDVWLSPIEFEDHGDGLGDVHIAPRWPAQTPGVSVTWY